MPERMTDDEIICSFMEPKPPLPDRYSHISYSPGNWWILGPVNGGGMRWYPSYRGMTPLGLDALFEVEVRLTDKQRNHYISHIASLNGLQGRFYADAWVYLHATVEQKTSTLATILRPLVEVELAKGEK